MSPTLHRRERGKRKDVPTAVPNPKLKRVDRGNDCSHSTFAQSCSPEVSGEFPAQARICGYSDNSSSSHSGRQQDGGGLEGQDGHSRSNSGVSVLQAIDRNHPLPSASQPLPSNTLLLGNLQRQFLSPLGSAARWPRGSLGGPKPPISPLTLGGSWHRSPSLTSGGGNGQHSTDKTTIEEVAVGSGRQGPMLARLDLNEAYPSSSPTGKGSNHLAGRTNTTETTTAQNDKKQNGNKRCANMALDDGSDGSKGLRHKPWAGGEAPLNIGSGVKKASDSERSTEREECVPGLDTSNGIPDYALVALCGRRAEMEDTVAAVPRVVLLPKPDGCSGGQACRWGQQNGAQDVSPEAGLVTEDSLHFFGVYDGHGGGEVAVHCAENLHHNFADRLCRVLLSEKKTSPGEQPALQASIEAALFAAFDEIDAEVGGTLPDSSARQLPGRAGRSTEFAGDGAPQDGKEPLVNDSVGTTAVCAVLSPSHLVVANCGDSRAALGKGGETVNLTVDHKPNHPDELERIQRAGGYVVNWDGVDRVCGSLAMSRAIGDRFLKPFIIATPEVTTVERSAADEFLILASDGLWDVVANHLACEIVRRCFQQRRSSSSKRGTVPNPPCPPPQNVVRDPQTVPGPAASASAVAGAVGPAPPLPSRPPHLVIPGLRNPFHSAAQMVVGSSTAVQHSSSPNSPASMAVTLLAKLAIARGSVDNISIVVVDLRK